jgi:hypothetical protein
MRAIPLKAHRQTLAITHSVTFLRSQTLEDSLIVSRGSLAAADSPHRDGFAVAGGRRRNWRRRKSVINQSPEVRAKMNSAYDRPIIDLSENCRFRLNAGALLAVGTEA